MILLETSFLRERSTGINTVIKNIERVFKDAVRDKFCRLDVAMLVNRKRVDLEIQVRDEHDFPERTLFHWARDYSTSLAEGGKYRELPQVIIISIMAFKQFECHEYHSEFRPLEVTQHTLLSDRMVMHYFELPKLPEEISAGDGLLLWLKLFAAETEEELEVIKGLEVPVMEQAINIYRGITASAEFKELERLRSYARHNEASALANAREEERAKWQTVVAEKDAKWQGVVEEKNAELQNKDAEIARLKTLLERSKQGG